MKRLIYLLTGKENYALCNMIIISAAGNPGAEATIVISSLK
jgi:hypothetical protein